MSFIKNKLLPAFLFLLLGCKSAMAFQDTIKSGSVNASILLPLYLDTLFKAGAYAYGNSVPRFALPALEFYHGAQMAIDSLDKEGIKAHVEIVDSRKPTALPLLFNQYSFYKPKLVIGMVQSAAELRQVADMSLQNNIPFISATYPNDGGITSNPNLLIANSTLKTHCYALYKYLLQKHANENIVLFYRQSAPGDRIKFYLNEAEETNTGKKLNWKIASLHDTFNLAQVAVYLNKVQSNVIVGGSLNDDFSNKLIKTLSSLKDEYKSSVFGMPTWDEYKLTKPEYRGVDVYYTTPFISYTSNASLYNTITSKFSASQFSKPSDMVFKGFELTYRYLKTLYQNPDSFFTHMNDSSNKVFAEIRFEPVNILQNEAPDYWENKKIYFIKKTDGIIKAVY